MSARRPASWSTSCPTRASTTARFSGPPPVPILDHDTLESLTERVHDAEHRLLVHVLADMSAKGDSV